MKLAGFFRGIITPGIARAERVLVPNSSLDLRGIRNHRVTRTILGEGAADTAAMAGNETLTAAMILGGIIVRDPGGAGRNLTFPTAALLVAAVPGATVGDIIETLIVNGADAAEALTLVAGSGGGFDANQTAASRVIAQNNSKLVRTRLTNVTASSEAYVIYS